MFRPAEKRPPSVVSNAFTGLVLAPLLLLFILWLRIGVNFNNLSLNLYTLGFHVGLGGNKNLVVLFSYTRTGTVGLSEHLIDFNSSIFKDRHLHVSFL